MFLPLGTEWQLVCACCKPAAPQQMVLETSTLYKRCRTHGVLIEGVQHAFASCEVAAAQYAVLRPYCRLNTLLEEPSGAEWRSKRPGKAARPFSWLITAMQGLQPLGKGRTVMRSIGM